MRLVASFPIMVKRRYDIERDGWNAQIKVDYDEKHIPMRRVQRVAGFFAKRRLNVLDADVRATRKGFHLRIWLDKDIGQYTALKAQEILGDDPMRQKFNRKRVRKKKPGWNVLFNEKWRGEKCIMREEKDETMTNRVCEVLL